MPVAGVEPSLAAAAAAGDQPDQPAMWAVPKRASTDRVLMCIPAIEMVGTRTWFSGRATCLLYLAHVIGSPGDWRMTPTLANGQPAAVARYRDSAYGLSVLTVTPAGIARITVFGGGPDLAAKFGFPLLGEGATGQAPGG